MAQQEAEQQLRDILLLFQQHVQQTLDPTHSPHLSASQRNHIRHVAQHIFHHLAGPVRKTVSCTTSNISPQHSSPALSFSLSNAHSLLICLLCCVCAGQWLNALDTHLASLPTPSSTPDATHSSAPTPLPFPLLTDLATAQSQLTDQHGQLTTTLQHAIDTLRTTNLELIPEHTTNTPTTHTTHTANTPTKRRKTAAPHPTEPAALLEEDDASRVVEARAEVDNVLDEVNELLKKERLELAELHTFLTSHPSPHDSGSTAVAVAGGEAGRVAGGGSGVVGGGAVSGGSSASSSQLSSPSSGHSKQVAAGLAKRLNRSAAM